jgi:hypothetical protein
MVGDQVAQTDGHIQSLKNPLPAPRRQNQPNSDHHDACRDVRQHREVGVTRGKRVRIDTRHKQGEDRRADKEAKKEALAGSWPGQRDGGA